MTNLALWIVLGLVVGYASGSESAHACSCLGYRGWRLTLIDASPGVDRAAWTVDNIFFNRTSDRHHALYGNAADGEHRFELDLEAR